MEIAPGSWPFFVDLGFDALTATSLPDSLEMISGVNVKSKKQMLSCLSHRKNQLLIRAVSEILNHPGGVLAFFSASHGVPTLPTASRQTDMNGSSSSSSPTLAFTAAATDPASRLHWVGEQADAVEFSPDPNHLDRLAEMVRPLLAQDRPVRFHTRYFEHELGHADPALADLALEAHLRTLRAMVGLGEPVVTVHTGLDPRQPVQESRFVENLGRLVAHGKDLGIAVCLENLRFGPSSEPANVLSWAEQTGALITLDVGHALGSEAACRGRCSVERFVDLFADRLFEVHIYGREDDQGHHPIEDIAPFRPLMAKLLQTECAWWTIELQRPEHILATRALLLDALGQAVSPSHPSPCEAEPHPVFPMRSRLAAPGRIRPCSLMNCNQASRP